MVLFPLKNSLSLLSSSKTHCSINSFSISGKKGLQKEWFINTVDENHPQKVSLYKYNKITLFQKEVVFIISKKKKIIKNYFYNDSFYKKIIKKKRNKRNKRKKRN